MSITPSPARVPSAALRTTRLLVPVIALCVLFVSACVPLTDHEGASLGRVNDARANRGIPRLVPTGDATAKARDLAHRMAREGRLIHSTRLSSGLASGWSSLGENVGMGANVHQVHDLFMGSTQHRRNIVNPGFRTVGVGVAVDGRGRVWVAQVFVG
ncbi:hypothetical protein BH24ACT3_BH24ACT3_05270 [soil metagenome]